MDSNVNEVQAGKLRKLVTVKSKRWKVYSRCIGGAEIRSLSSKNCCVKYLLCVIDVFIRMLG